MLGWRFLRFFFQFLKWGWRVGVGVVGELIFCLFDIPWISFYVHIIAEKIIITLCWQFVLIIFLSEMYYL